MGSAFFLPLPFGDYYFSADFFLILLLLSVSSVTGKRKTERRLVYTIILVVLIGVILIGIQPILERFTNQKLLDESRWLYYQYTLGLIKDYPCLGSGLGTYVKAINHYLGKDFYVIINHAHNDYLEMLGKLA